MKVTQRTLNPNTLTLQDVMHIVSVADTSQDPAGSSYKETLLKVAQLMRRSGMANWNTVNPTVNDDVTAGYINGSFWWNEGTGNLFVLNDNSAGVADWVNLNAPTEGRFTPTLTVSGAGVATAITQMEWWKIGSKNFGAINFQMAIDGAESLDTITINLTGTPLEPANNFGSEFDIIGSVQLRETWPPVDSIRVRAVAASKSIEFYFSGIGDGQTFNASFNFVFNRNN